MRFSLVLAAITLAAAPSAVFAQPAFHTGPFFSREQSLNLTFAESMLPIQRVHVNLRFDDAGQLVGSLKLDPNRLDYNEFGEETGRETEQSEMSFDCTLKLQKEADGKRLYSLRGPKIISRLSMVLTQIDYAPGRLLIHDKAGKVKQIVELYQPLPEPCHPGCFPKGSLVRAGDKLIPIEKLHVGDEVTVLDAKGEVAAAKIVEAFENRNALIEIRTKDNKLVTTKSQPLAIEGGEFRAAGDVKAGDVLLRWTGEKPEAAPVTEIVPAADDAAVYNLVLGDPTTFIVGDFLVQSKPPPVAILLP